MTAAEFNAVITAEHRKRDDLFLRLGRLQAGADELRDAVRILRISVDVERDIAEACR